VLSKTCENCHGDGEIRNVRDATIDDLTDAQTKLLLHADIYRESGGEEAKQEAQQMQQQAHGAQHGQIPNNPKSMSSAPTSGHNL